MKKIIILLIVLVTLSGCSMEYTVRFNKSGTVDEVLRVEELQKHFYETELDDFKQFKNNRVANITLLKEYDDDLAFYRMVFKKNYDTSDIYFEDEFFKKYVGSYSFDDGDEWTIKVIFNDAFKMNMYGTNDVPPYIDDLSVSIIIPYNVIKSNATSVDENTYVWNITKDSNLNEMYVVIKNPNIQDKTNENAFKVLVGIVIVGVIVLTILVINKNKKSNAL